MEYKEINELLSNLNKLRNGRNKVGEEVVKKIDTNHPEQDEEGLSYEIYSLPFDKEHFLRLTITTNSYGEDEQITGIEFVKPTKKTVTSYEPV